MSRHQCNARRIVEANIGQLVRQVLFSGSKLVITGQLSKVDLLGFSLGGFVSQVIAQQQPGLVRKIILAGTGPAGDNGIVNVDSVLQNAFGKAGAANRPSHRSTRRSGSLITRAS